MKLPYSCKILHLLHKKRWSYQCSDHIVDCKLQHSFRRFGVLSFMIGILYIFIQGQLLSQNTKRYPYPRLSPLKKVFDRDYPPLCTSSGRILQVCNVSFSICSSVKEELAYKTYGWTDRLTDRLIPIYPPPHFFARGITIVAWT